MDYRITLLSLAVVTTLSAASAAPLGKRASKAHANELKSKQELVVPKANETYRQVLGKKKGKINVARQAAATLSEDFTKFTKGSEATPDVTDVCSGEPLESSVTIPEEYTQMPGWHGYGIFQAGGSAYIGMVDFSYAGDGSQMEPGFLNTPDLDLSANGGSYRVKFRAKSKDSSTDQMCLVSIVGDEVAGYADVDLTTEWKDYSVNLPGGKSTSIQMYSYTNASFIDDIAVTSDALQFPQNIKVSDYNGTSATVSWDAVEGADSYSVELFYADYDLESWMPVKDIPTTGTSVNITGLNAQNEYSVILTAIKGEERSSSPRVLIEVDLGIPENVTFSDLSLTSFTANWQAVEGADAYAVAAVYYDDNYEPVYAVQKSDITTTSTRIEGLDLAAHTYYFVVAAMKNGMVGESTDAMAVKPELETPVAKDATNVTNTGFTANWDAVEFGQRYGVKVYTEYMATKSEKYSFLKSGFDDIKEGTLDEPVQDSSYDVGDTDWFVNYVSFANGMLGIDSRYGDLGYPGNLISPEMDFSMNGGKVNIDMTVLGDADATNLNVYFIDSEYNVVNDNIIVVPVTSEAKPVNLVLEGGGKGCSIVIESASGVVFVDEIDVYTTLGEGDKLILPFASRTVDNATSLEFKDLVVPENVKVFYNVQAGFFPADQFSSSLSGISNDIYVPFKSGAVAEIGLTGGAYAYVADGVLRVVNPDGESVGVYSVSGALVATGADEEPIALPDGMYIVRIGAKSVKVIVRN